MITSGQTVRAIRHRFTSLQSAYIYRSFHISMGSKQRRLNYVLHLLLATTLILKGADKFPKHNLLGGMMLVIGAIVLLYFIYTVVKKSESRIMHILILIFEAIVSLFIAYIFFEEGKKYVQYAFVIAAIGFLVSAVIAIKNKQEH